MSIDVPLPNACARARRGRGPHRDRPRFRTGDADAKTEKNGSTFNTIALAVVCRSCVLARRGNDMLVKGGTPFHVVTTQQTHVRVSRSEAGSRGSATRT